jgi:hypothetical protein
MHLLTKGFMENYLCWYAHGELFVPDKSMEEQVVGSTSSASNMHEVGNENSNPYRNIVMDVIPMESPTDLCISQSARMSDTCPFVQIPTDFLTDRKVWRDFWTFFCAHFN